MAQPGDLEPDGARPGAADWAGTPRGQSPPAAAPPYATPPPRPAPWSPPAGRPRAAPVDSGGNVAFLDRPGAPPVTRGDGGMWLFFAVLGFLFGQIAGFVLVLVAAAIAGQAGQLASIAKLSAPPEWYVGASLVGLWIGFFLGPLIASMTRGTRHLAKDLGLRFEVIDLVGIAIGIGGQIMVAIMYAPFAQHLKNFNAPTTKLTGASHGGGFAVIAVMTVVGAPFFEELFFRGLILRGLVRVLAPSRPGRSAARAVAVTAAVLLDGLIFGAAHAELVQLAGLAAFGAVLAFVSYRTGRLGMNMVAHASFNLIAVVAILQSR
ncbi:MAG TPA: CPBP family intramembrane glutamic endopeptidase [Acidimicrobiales bacterium]|nr:CPBP family intramembrane glutamic endopeptidase [Acidimicrobiales bacterium]